MIAILIILAGAINGIMDEIKFHNAFPNSKFWNAESWRNVYKNGDPLQGERFFLSTSILSFLCDGWHLMKEIMISCLCLAIAIAIGKGIIITYLVMRIFYGIGFYITYNLLIK
jgi:hypothetical protein